MVFITVWCCFCSLVWSLRRLCLATIMQGALTGCSQWENWRALSVCVSRWLMHAAMFFFFLLLFFFLYTVPFYKLLLLYRISPGEEQQGCFHSNTEASDWQPMVSVVLLPNPQIELPLHYSKYWSFSVPSGGESVDPLELTQHYWYVVFLGSDPFYQAFLILTQQSLSSEQSREKILWLFPSLHLLVVKGNIWIQCVSSNYCYVNTVLSRGHNMIT